MGDILQQIKQLSVRESYAIDSQFVNPQVPPSIVMII
jgi:hypothetical protein